MHPIDTNIFIEKKYMRLNKILSVIIDTFIVILPLLIDYLIQYSIVCTRIILGRPFDCKVFVYNMRIVYWIACLTRTVEVVGSSPIKDPRSFLEQ